MAGRLTRFLNLEKRRKPGEGPAHEVLTPGRFSAAAGGFEEGSSQAPAASHSVVTPGRFEPPELQLSQDHGEQPFLRCPSCEADNGRFALKCINCGVRLDTAEVRTFNQHLWAQRYAEAEAARAAEVEHQKTLAADQRALGEAIAREVAERERARWAVSPGMRLLSRLLRRFWD